MENLCVDKIFLDFFIYLFYIRQLKNQNIMKKFIIPLFLVLLVSCEKEDSKTTIAIINSFNEPIYWIELSARNPETQNIEIVASLGSLEAGESTGKIEMEGGDINELGINFTFDLSATETVVDYILLKTFSIKKGEHNEYIISEQSELFGGTTYYILNSSNTQLFNVYSGYWNGNTFKEVRSHATLMPGKRSFHILTNYSEITLNLELPGLDNDVFSAEFNVVKNEVNKFEITQEDVDYLYSLD